MAFVACVALVTGSARADCYYGDPPTYDEVERVQISDCWPTGPDRPCYYANVEESGGRIIGTYVGARGSSRLGVFDLVVGPNDQKNFERMLAALREAKVFERGPQLKPPVNGIVMAVLDGRHYTLSLDRCLTNLTIFVPNSEFDSDVRMETRWSILAPALETLTDAFSWKLRLGPDNGRDIAAVWSMGLSLRYAKR